MKLALNLILILLIELPVVAFFFRRKKRNNALLMALLINIISWIIINIIRLSGDVNIYVEIGIVIVEAVAYQIMLECGWRKAAIISLIANGLSFLIANWVWLNVDLNALFRETNRIVQ